MADRIRLIVFKIIELIFAIIICSLFLSSFEKEAEGDRTMVLFVGLTAFMWVPPIYALGMVISNPVHTSINMLTCLVLAIFSLAASCLLFKDAKTHPMADSRTIGFVAAVFGLFNFILLVSEIVMDFVFNIGRKQPRNLSLEALD